jgi:hypothetical protein
MEISKANFSNLDTIPNDVLYLILGKLEYKDLNSLSKVNKQLHRVANDNLLWKKKLADDLIKWDIISSNNYPAKLFDSSDVELNLKTLDYKSMYSKCCPDVLTQIEILKKLDAYNKHADKNDELTTQGILQSPMQILHQIKGYFFNSYLYNEISSRFLADGQTQSKIIMFGPGLETTTCCLVTNLLWKSDFQPIGMIPGLNGYGSGIKLKLFNHEPFNLTILYTNVINERQNKSHNLAKNKLLVKRPNNDAESTDESYEVNDRVKEACLNTTGFVYVIDNTLLTDCMTHQPTAESTQLLKNYKHELVTLMRASDYSIPILLLLCSKDNDSSSLSCSQVVDLFKLHELDHEWQIRKCNVFESKMNDIVLGFDWLLNKIDMSSKITL